ncbi:hypothetical protein DXV75_15815 [Alteromonas aestuariivivens]|uniref:Uncharacterized protein n=1 Tax=Alteromonas aestuariivivens TaxID=1938339 RepID=A0A3D8M4G5_9ALTE|nr:hypothetical protein DXV75_15815 [Alteromonas aestuariivivens]
MNNSIFQNLKSSLFLLHTAKNLTNAYNILSEDLVAKTGIDYFSMFFLTLFQIRNSSFWLLHAIHDMLQTDLIEKCRAIVNPIKYYGW